MKGSTTFAKWVLIETDIFTRLAVPDNHFNIKSLMFLVLFCAYVHPRLAEYMPYHDGNRTYVLCEASGQAYFSAFPVWIQTQSNSTFLPKYITQSYLFESLLLHIVPKLSLFLTVSDQYRYLGTIS